MKSEEEKFREAINKIMSIGQIKTCEKCKTLLPDKERDEYIKTVFQSIIENIEVLKTMIKKELGIENLKDLKKMGLISQAKAVGKLKDIIEIFFKDMGKQKEIIIASLIYTIKPEFREEYIKLIEKITAELAELEERKT